MGHQGFVSREFVSASGARECYLSIDVAPDLVFADQLEALRVAYAAAKAEMGLSPGSAIFRRIFLSDAMNQAERVRVSELMAAPDEGPVAVSIVQQPPAHGAKLALLAYHVERDAPVVKRTLGHHHTLVEMGGLRHLWSTRMCAAADVGPASAADQTREVFHDLIGALAAQGGTLRDDCVRTWLYIRDVDVFYQDMVKSRAQIFKREGLTGDTHFIASTGIEGACAHHYDLVAMDAYSVLGLAQGQISYLNDFDHLCATKDYGVTFERATRVAYGDRAHIFMSGTASIDGEGWVVHPGDVLRQLDRALENVDALLGAGEMQLADLTHLIVYLRDRGDYCAVRDRLGERFPSLPLQIVQGPVCRPEWLIEVEGIAAKAIQRPGLPAF
jgi:enamine deaminase RidA (YjgF/YER057c/UK114 family)